MRVIKLSFAALVLWSRFGVRGLNWRAWKMLMTYPGIGIVYNRIKKNANTTTALLLREIETGMVDALDDAKARYLSVLPYREIWALRNRRLIVIVRNPYSRLLSAFLDKFRLEEYRRQHGDFSLTPEGFAAFVDWLASGNVDKNGHWREQTYHIFLPLKKFDTVVRFENLKPEILSFLAASGLQAPEERLDSLYPSDINKRTSADTKLHHFYTPRVAGIVTRLYAKDFDALGYSTEFPAQMPEDQMPEELSRCRI